MKKAPARRMAGPYALFGLPAQEASFFPSFGQNWEEA
jgi:hypothetical protein